MKNQFSNKTLLPIFFMFFSILALSSLFFFKESPAVCEPLDSKYPPTYSRKAFLSDSNIIPNSINNSAFKIFSEIYTKDENIFFSPTSLFTAISMLQNGCSEISHKELLSCFFSDIPENLSKEAIDSQMNDFLCYLNSYDSNSILKFSNSLWIDDSYRDSINKDFISNCTNNYYAHSFSCDFINDTKNSVSNLNKWVKESTNGLIPKILSPEDIDKTFMLALINTLYFKGSWDSEFPVVNTKKALFTDSLNEKKHIHMMSQKEHLDYYENDKYQLIKKDYKGRDTSFKVILPRDKISLDTLIYELTPNWWETHEDLCTRKSVLLSIPRFEFEYSKALDSTLKKLGLNDIYNPNSNPIPYIHQDAYVSLIKQSSFISVTEKETKAAAATIINIKTGSAPEEPEIFTADHPFLFIISDNATNSILFIGVLNTP